MTASTALRVVMFYHSLVSDWNHGNAHFLRGVAVELLARGHDVSIYEPRDGWSLGGLVGEAGDGPIRDFERTFPTLRSTFYDRESLDLDHALDGADVVLVHEWNEPWLVTAVGDRREHGGAFALLFHDTHHRAVTSPDEMRRYDLSAYDGVLAYGNALRDLYLERDWTVRAWTWHEAADTRIFTPVNGTHRDGVVWIGNWGDDERTAELEEFLLTPVRELGLRGSVYGVRYPPSARARIEQTGLAYRGWLANHHVPATFGRHAVTVHIPRRPYVRALPGIPTIRVFEALACGIPLVCAPWSDAEGLFEPGADYLVARDGGEMTHHLRELLRDRALARSLTEHGRRTVLERHTCAHRVDELLTICHELGHAHANEGGP